MYLTALTEGLYQGKALVSCGDLIKVVGSSLHQVDRRLDVEQVKQTSQPGSWGLGSRW